MAKVKDSVVLVAKDAAEDWFVDTGKIKDRREFDVSKKFTDFGITRLEFSNFSEAIVCSVRRSTGKTLDLPDDWHDRFHSATVAEFLTALPGQPGTPSSRPGSLPGKPTTSASHPGSLPAKPKAT